MVSRKHHHLIWPNKYCVVAAVAVKRIHVLKTVYEYKKAINVTSSSDVYHMCQTASN